MTLLTFLLTTETGLVKSDPKVLDRPAVRLLQTDFYFMIKIRTFHRAALPTPKPPKHLSKYIGWERVTPLLRTVWCPKLVKILALLGVAQDLIGLLDLFELLGVTALVGVVFAGKFVIGFPDGAVLRLSGDS
jgi:hypothetical protein